MNDPSWPLDPVSMVEARLRLNRAVFSWALGRAEQALEDAAPETAARWAGVAAQCASAFGCGALTSVRLESLLLKLGARLPRPGRAARGAGGRPRWLHVFSLTYPVGGHTALAARWIAYDATAIRHSVILTAQKTLQNAALAEAVGRSGGSVATLDGIQSIGERAGRLRELAWAEADIVVLHTHMWDIFPAMAFAIPGGPPVIVVNHADHAFWVGAGIADQLVHIRASGREFSRWYRGVHSDVELPVPLPAISPSGADGSADTPRSLLGIPPTATVLLTIGSEHKYTALGRIDFVAVARRILQRNPGTYLVAVGPRGRGTRWQQALQESAGRLICIGEQTDLAPFHAMANVYLESFPFGSLTALLEAGLAGLPCVRAPALCPPPFVSDGAALEGLAIPATLDDHVAQVSALLADPPARHALGAGLSRRIAQFHCGDAWLQALNAVKRALPASHDLSSLTGTQPLPAGVEAYWGLFASGQVRTDPLAYLTASAAALGLEVELDPWAFADRL